MIFARAARREFAQTTLTVFVALLAILVVTQSIRLLGQAASGRIGSDAVLALLGFGVLNLLPVTLTLALFVGILLALGRAWRDSEMTIWFSAGVSLLAWMRPVFAFAAPFVVLIAVLSLFLTPWAIGKRAEYLQRLDNRHDVARVTPGNFRESTRGDRVFFVESLGGQESDGPTRVRNVFISQSEHGRVGVVAAAEGFLETMPSGDRYIVLRQGRRYEMMPGEREYRLIEFARYAFRIEETEVGAAEAGIRSQPTLALLTQPSPAGRGELVWRFGLPLAALLLALLAIPVSFVNPRAGRAYNLLIALLVFVTYSNLLSLGQAWVAQERLSFAAGLVGVHGVMACLLAIAFGRRMLLFSWGRWWRR